MNILEDWAEWITELAAEILKGIEDKKFTIWETIALTDNALKLPRLIKRYKEFSSLEITEQMQKDIAIRFALDLELQDKKAEKLAELIVEGILFNVGFALKIVELTKK